VRLGYGLSGNQNIPNYRYMTLFSPRPSLGSTILENDGMFGNPNLKWEVQKQFNTGLDISLLNSKLNLVFDYFLINNDDLLMERTKAGSSGYLRELANVGAMENKGIEISVNANLVETRDFSWGGGLTFSSARNKITRLYDGVETVWKLGGYSNNEIQREGNLFVGESINNIYVYKFDRIVQESDMDYVNSLDLGNRIVKPGDILPEDRDHNGIINDKDRYVVGNTDPDFYGGIHTTLAYKGLSLNVVTTYSVGADRISYLYETLMDNSGLLSTHEDMKNRWTPENTNTNIPRAYNLGDWGLLGGRYGVGETDWAVQDASFFRISTMTLAYNFPTTLINKAKIGSLRVYVTGNNLFTFTKYKGFDPEGGDWYPTSKMYVVGLNLSF
ncbi:MAG: TonB-dependent receptor, partial [Dysgonamonadaceae bacterium]|jgi:outer membrane receptor protein involved in Fe transport|nr:TonB-dependent receptor [Dysgonamonadaceae bacterium]